MKPVLLILHEYDLKTNSLAIPVLALLACLALTTGCRTPADKVPCTSGNHEWGSWQVDTNHYYADGGYGFYRMETRECLKCHLVVARKIIPE
jgi:hypothetical protein